MTSLTSAIATRFAYERQSGTRVYNGAVSKTWTIGAVPHGGYILSLALTAALQRQRELDSPHLDPAHLHADFLTPSSVGALQVEVTALSTSKRWTRLDVEVWQYQQPSDLSTPRILRVRAHIMLTELPSLAAPTPPTAQSITIMPHTPIPEARICPLKIHPSQCEKGELYRAANFRELCSWSEEVGVRGVGGEQEKEMKWGAWWQMEHEEDDVRSNVALVPFFADQFRNGPELAANSIAPSGSWYPTLTFSLAFTSKFPLAPIPSMEGSTPASHTVGLYSTSKFVSEGRHDITVEVWSAPGGLGVGELEKDGEEWRRKCQVLGVSTQMALTIPFEVNLRRGKM